jgi:hypothetical protein
MRVMIEDDQVDLTEYPEDYENMKLISGKNFKG